MVSWRSVSFHRFVFFPVLLILVLTISQGVLASTIAGTVYDNYRTPIAEVDVELLNEYYQLRDRRKTDGSGRYQFDALPDGRYTVRVLPFRFDFEDQEAPVELISISVRGEGLGNTFQTQDFYLKAKSGGLGETTTGVVFAQDVPKKAENYYKDALEAFKDKRESDGIKNLLDAIRILPTYYAALQRLGMALYARKQYLEAAQAFMEAVNTNPKSSLAFYSMGMSLHGLGKDYNKAAIAALNKAAFLAPASVKVAFWLGKIERIEGDFENAEKSLLKAKKLASDRDPAIHIELAQLYGNDLKQYDKAADELELYLKASKMKDEKIKNQIADLRRKAKEGS
jgi:tetratricopeptide (TPR) repeat protein